MSLFVNNPSLFWLAPLVAAPLLIHMFVRARPPVFNFSSNRFLSRIMRARLRMNRPIDIIVLILRTLAFILLLLVFTRPVWFMHGGFDSVLDPHTTVVLIDASASMGYVESGRTRFAEACASASEILDDMKPGDSANLIFMRAEPVAALPDPGLNRSHLQETLRQAECSQGAANIEAAMGLALDMLAKSEGVKELCVISDFQASAWRDLKPEFPEDVHVMTVPIAHSEAPNLALAGLTVDPANPLVGETVNIICEVRNFSSEARAVDVLCSAGAYRKPQTIMLEPWSTQSVAFNPVFESHGTVPVSIRLDDNLFAPDNVLWHVLPVRSALQIVLGAGDTGDMKRWRRLIQAFGWMDLHMVHPSAFASTLDDADVLVLAGWNGVGADDVRHFMKNGGSVFWAPEKDLPSSVAREILELDEAQLDSIGMRTVNRARKVSIENADALELNTFRDNAHGDPTNLACKLYWSLPKLPPDVFQPVLAYPDGTVALGRFKTIGNLEFWNLTLDPEASNLAMSGEELIPLFGETILSLHRSRGIPSPTVMPGQRLFLSLEELGGNSENVVLVSENDEVSCRESGSGFDRRIVSDPLPRPGLYTWKDDDKTISRWAVNLPEIESDMRVVEKPFADNNQVALLGSATQVKTNREGMDLWPLALVLGTVALCAEAILLRKS